MNASESQSSSDTMMMDIDQPLHHHSANSDHVGQRTSLTTTGSTLQPQATPSSSSRRAEDVIMNGGEAEGSSSQGAGPSTLPFYTIATIRDGPPHLRMRLHASQDLITRLGLLTAFDGLVRPFIRVPEADGGGGTTGVPSVDEKGKGKEVDMGRMQGVEGPDGQQLQMSPSAGGAGGFGAGTSSNKLDGAEDKKEHKNGWRSFVQPQVSGKFSTKKDTYLGDLVSYQARPPMKIRPFDLGTLNGFRLEEGQLDAATLQQLGLGPDDKKKKKKKKKLLPDGTAAPADSSTAGPSQAGASPAPGLNGGTPRSSQAVPSPRPSIHPAYLKANSSPYPQSNRPPLPQTPSQPPSSYVVNGNTGNPWHGQPVPPEINGPPKPPGATAVMSIGKATRVRKERDEAPGTPGGLQAGGQGQAGQPRPYKKRKTDGHSPSPGPNQHHGMAAHHQQQQPMQQATPTF